MKKYILIISIAVAIAAVSAVFLINSGVFLSSGTNDTNPNTVIQKSDSESQNNSNPEKILNPVIQPKDSNGNADGKAEQNLTGGTDPVPTEKEEYSKGDLSLSSLGRPVDIKNYAAKTEKEMAVFKIAASWINEMRTVDFKNINNLNTTPGNQYTTGRFQKMTDGSLPGFKSEVLKKHDTKQVLSLYLEEIGFQAIPELDNQDGAFLEFLMDYKLSQLNGGYAVVQCKEKVILIYEQGAWKVDAETFEQLKVYHQEEG
ncbi:hypothetical protein [Dehalobacter sp. 14DCB1]|uniref:hypothetical protein n=1 Tax=Dehalobacter sp. 14DCB1 TaxID=2070227 RepID=UPI00104A14B8|nr:hypothetical protein [Dehalobacter sp. 14DCB1]TCX48927.1 hypothetical protein C1I36_12750 [Dehalobacter sp. 14DCB1]